MFWIKEVNGMSLVGIGDLYIEHVLDFLFAIV